MGVETDLMLFNIFNFCGVYLLWEDYVASAAITYTLYHILCMLRRRLARYNIAHKGLVDVRFLKL